MANKKLMCMHEQDFEKQVQQKMEELSLTPSAPVWQKVEKQIRTKKDRRRLIFWLLPLLLVGGGAGWMLWSTPKEGAPANTVRVLKQPSVSSQSVTGSTPALSAPANERDEKNTTASSPQDVTEFPHTTINNQPKRTAQQPKPSKITHPKLTAPTASAGQEVAYMEKTAASPTSDLAAETHKKVLVTDATVMRQEAVTSKEIAITSQEKVPIPAGATDSAATFLQQETETKTTEILPPAATIATAASAADSTAVTQTAPAQMMNTSKWQWTVHAEAGITSVWSTLFQLPTTRSYDAFSSPVQYSGGNNFFAYYPSPQDEGLAFSAGLTAKRIVSRRTKLTAGLQYNFYSTRLAVGQQKNTTATATVPYARQSMAAPNAYLPGTQNDYTNRYHFIQLPIGLEFQAFANLPLQVHGGVSLAHLVKTNALSYDYRAQGYYQNSNAFNATQLHLFTNITYTVWKGRFRKLDIGPYIQYSLTELQKTATDKNRLFSTGLRTQFSF
jgi:hypothetical protein